MSFYHTSVKRPLTISMIVVIVMLLGMYVFFRIPIDLFPDIETPVVTVTVKYPGASPEEVENGVTDVLEKELNTLENLKRISSVSSQNVARIFVEFNYGTNIDLAENKVKSKIDAVLGDLPSTIEVPVVEKVSPADLPVVEVALFGERDDVDLKMLTTFAEDWIKPSFQKIPGVASVTVFGGRTNEVSVALDPNRLQAFHLSINQVEEAIKKDSVTFAVGKAREGQKELSVKVDADLRDLYQLENISIPTPTGPPVRLKDLGTVKTQEAENNQYAYYNGQKALAMFVYKQKDANTLDVAQRLKAEIERILPELQTAGANIAVTNDSSAFIDKSIRTLAEHGLIGATLAVVILYLFLADVAATLVVSTAIPISIVTTFLLMYFSDLSINLITLGALTLGIGLMIDDAVVVLENIFRHYREERKTVFQAAVDGVRQISAPVIASTITKMIVFLPLLFVQGLTGQLFLPLALTVMYSLLASLVVSLTVTPTITAMLLGLSERSKWLSRQGKIARFLTTSRHKLLNGYRGFLEWALNHKAFVLSPAVISVVIGVALAPLVGGEFMPKMDSGEFTIHIDMPPGAKTAETDRVVKSILDRLHAIPEVQETFVGLGATQSNPTIEQTDKAYINVNLVGKRDRKRSTADVVETVRRELAMPGVKLKVQEKGFVVSSLFSSDPVYITVKGENIDMLNQISSDITRIVRTIPGVRDADNSLGLKKVEFVLNVDQEKAKLHGLDVLTISRMMKTMIDGDVVASLKTKTGDIDIRVGYDLTRGQKPSINELLALSIPTQNGFVPLSDLVVTGQNSSPSDIYRENQVRMAFVTADLYQTDLQTVNATIHKQLESYPLPKGYTIEFGGETKDMAESFSQLGISLILAIILIYAVMVAEFETFRHPFIIMFSIPATAIGITGSLLLFNRHFSISSIMGMIMLAGIIVSNGIVMIDLMKQLREKGLSAREAVLRAGPLRLTPVLITAGAAVFAVLPLAVATSEGSEMNAPMATVVMGGLSVGTLITLVIIPVLYDGMETLRARRKRYPDRSAEKAEVLDK